tara:strand:- start:207 stop:2885 length:2679 start_codon:yes stop_codon:yes gene_type:complete
MAEDFGPNGALQGIVKEPKLEAQDKSLQQDFVDWAADNLQGRPGTLGSRIGLSVDPYTAYKYSRKIFGDMNSADPDNMGIGLTDFTPMGAVFALDDAKRDFEGVGKKFEEGDILGGAIDAGLTTGVAALSVAEAVPLTKTVTRPVKGFLRSLGGKLPQTAPSMVSGPNTAPMEKLIQLKPMTDQFGTEVPDAQKYLDSVSKSPPLYDEANRGAIVAPEAPVVDKIIPEAPVVDKIIPEPPVVDKIIPEPPAPDIDPQGFYSAMSRAVDALPQKKGKGSQMLSMITKSPGVKAEEMSWTGLDDFLKGKKNVTKAEIQEYVDANQVRIEEVVKSEPDISTLNRAAMRDIEESLDAGQVLDDDALYAMESWLTATEYGNYRLARQYEALLEEKLRDAGDMRSVGDFTRSVRADYEDSSTPKFDEYTLPGGENYREVLLKMPQREVSNSELEALAVSRFGKEIEDLSSSELNQIVDMREGFRSGHYGGEHPNVLAHIRLNDRTGPDGERILFVEEIQSDWHQKGRETGYSRAEKAYSVRRTGIPGRIWPEFATQAEAEAYLEGLPKFKTTPKVSLEEGVGADGSRQYRVLSEDGEAGSVWRDDKAAIEKYIEKQNAKPDREIEYSIVEEEVMREGGVPDAPLKKTWQEASLRRVMRMAAEEGYDSVAWTPGRIQADRYDLSSQIDELRYQKNDDGTFNIVPAKDGETIQTEQFENLAEDRLAEAVGKEVAEKIVRGEGVADSGTSNAQILRGVDLEVGGEGMKGFYDKMIKNYANKFGKKFGAKVGTTKIQSDANVLEHMDSLVVENEAADGFTIEGLTQRLNRVVDRVTGGQVLNFRTRAEAEQFIQNELVDTEVWNLPITKKMRDSVLKKGVPLFGAAGLVAAGQEPNEEKESF